MEFGGKGCFCQPCTSVYVSNELSYTLQLMSSRHNVILMGDSLGDADMADGVPNTDTVFKIGFLYGDVCHHILIFSINSFYWFDDLNFSSQQICLKCIILFLSWRCLTIFRSTWTTLTLSLWMIRPWTFLTALCAISKAINKFLQER